MGENNLLPVGPSILRVDGFGACMISGYPFTSEDSFFQEFVRRIQADIGMSVASSTLSLGGFPVSRAVMHRARAIRNHPDFLVLQFGSTDITVLFKESLLARLRCHFPTSGLKVKASAGSRSRSKEACPRMGRYRSSLAREAFERVKSALCRVLRIEPVHGGYSTYKAAMENMCREFIGFGTMPILLAPFPHGVRASDRWAAEFVGILKEIALREGCIFVDTYNGLADVPKEDLLLDDNVHISKLGHQMVGALIYTAARERILETIHGKLQAVHRAALAA